MPQLRKSGAQDTTGFGLMVMFCTLLVLLFMAGMRPKSTVGAAAALGETRHTGGLSNGGCEKSIADCCAIEPGLAFFF